MSFLATLQRVLARTGKVNDKCTDGLRARLTVESLETRTLLAADVVNNENEVAADSQQDTEPPAIETSQSTAPVSNDFGHLPGDANRDGVFDQLDLLQLVRAGKYLTGEPADWSDGDWNGDNLFNQTDLIAALQLGTYSPQSNNAHTAGLATARAQLHPVNQSGIRGTVRFTDDGSTLTINGTARGLDPSGVYVSLIYDNKSVPGGPEACEPAIFDPTDPDFILDTMFVGVWDAGAGTLTAINTEGGTEYVPLNKIGTISIRDTSINGGFGPEAVVACARVPEHKAGK